ncbi:MAG: DNA ligase (NAD(+)) LigA, partial [Spirochaetales bacterium]
MATRVEELAAQIRVYQREYYTGEATISDAEFDLLWDELRRLDPGNALFQEVGDDLVDGYPKRRHVMPMGSQDKAADPEAFLKWTLKVNHDRYIVQFKMDGASMELQYREGRFEYGVTRGDGIVGDDITVNVRKMQGVPQVADSFTGAVRGEVLLSRTAHRDKYQDKANTRNAANGLMKRKDGVGVEDLQLICYDAVETTNPGFFASERAKLEWLSANGFTAVPYREFTDAEQIIAYRAEISTLRDLDPGALDALDYDIDGLVVKGDTIDPVDMARPRPEKQIAFK